MSEFTFGEDDFWIVHDDIKMYVYAAVIELVLIGR